MKILITSLLLLLPFAGMAQDEAVEPPAMQPRILALGSSPADANRFNAELAAQAKGYGLAFTDTETPRTVRQVYKNGSDGTLRIDYKFVNETAEGGGKGNTVVIYQRITGEAGVIAAIYNYLFGADAEADKLEKVSNVGTAIEYKGRQHRFMLEPDEYEPGYWMMTFVR